MSLGDYLQLLDWTGRQLAQGKKGRIPLFGAGLPTLLFGAGLPTPPEPILQRLQLDQKGWSDLASHFCQRFFVVADAPTTIDDTTSRINQHLYNVPSATC